MNYSPSRKALLLAARLLAGGTPAAVQKDLRKIMPGITNEWFNLAMDELRAAGWIASEPTGSGKKTKAKLKPELSEIGRNEIARELSMSFVPVKGVWPLARDQHLTKLATGVKDADALKSADKLAAAMLSEKMALKPTSSLSRAMEALVCKELGHPDASTFVELKSAVLSRTTQSPLPPRAKDLDKHIATKIFNISKLGLAELRAAAIAVWVGDIPGAGHMELPAFDLSAFAGAARRAAATSPTGWFGDNKVFISHAWKQYGLLSKNLELSAFKDHLIEAHRERLLTLSRADLVAAMNSEDVRQSESRYLNAEFHFILIEKDKP